MGVVAPPISLPSDQLPGTRVTPAQECTRAGICAAQSQRRDVLSFRSSVRACAWRRGDPLRQAAMEDTQEASLYKPVASWDADDVAAWIRGTRNRERIR